MNQEERLLQFEEHLRTEHKRSPISNHLKEVIYGGIDGIITTFAVVAGFSGAALSGETTTQLSFLVVLLFGLANLLADGVSMGLGNYLAVRSEQGLYNSLLTKEKKEINGNHDMEVEETKTILVSKGFSPEDADTLTTIYKKNENYWVNFMMSHELKLPDPMGENPLFSGIATFTSFIFFGFIPLIPFIVMGSIEAHTVFQFSATGAFLALILLGILKWNVIGTHPVRTILEVVLVGGVAASVAFLVGTFFAI